MSSSTTLEYAPGSPDARLAATRYGGVAIALHWLMAAAIVGQLTLGLWMIGLPDEPRGLQAYWFNLHKSTGLVLFALVLLRLLWRAWHPPPPLPHTVPAWKRRAADITHRLLYLCLLLAPVSGYLGSSFSPYPVRFFGTPLPRWIEPWEAGKAWMSSLHAVTVGVLVALVLLHVAAALWHLARRDGVFDRMVRPAGR